MYSTKNFPPLGSSGVNDTRAPSASFASMAGTANGTSKKKLSQKERRRLERERNEEEISRRFEREDAYRRQLEYNAVSEEKRQNERYEELRAEHEREELARKQREEFEREKERIQNMVRRTEYNLKNWRDQEYIDLVEDEITALVLRSGNRVFKRGNKSLYTNGQHKRESHVVFERSGSKRDQKVASGSSAGGPCPVCRIKHMVGHACWDHLEQKYVKPYTKDYTTYKERTGFYCYDDFSDDDMYFVDTLTPETERAYECFVFSLDVPEYNQWISRHPLKNYIQMYREKCKPFFGVTDHNYKERILDYDDAALFDYCIKSVDFEEQDKLDVQHLERFLAATKEHKNNRKTWSDER